MATEAPPAAPAAPVPPAAAPAAPVMQKAIVPPVSGFDHPDNARETARMERIRAATTPKAETPAEPAKVPEAPAKPVETPTIIKKDAPPIEAPDPVDSMKLPANANPESVTNFANLAKVAKERKALADAAQARATDLEKQLAAARTTNPADTVELERIRTEHKAAMDRLMVLDLQGHPDFVKQYVEPKKQALAQATEVMAYNGKEGIELAGLLAKPLKDFNAAVSEFTKDMNSADTATVAMALRQARELHVKEAHALSQSGELHKQMQEKAVRNQKTAFEAVASEVVPNFQKREITETMSTEARAEAAAYNESVDTLRSRAESIAFGKLGERDVASLAFKGAAMDHLIKHAVPHLERHVASQNEVIAQLRGELQALRGGNAPADISKGSAPAGSPDLSKMTVEQRVAYRLHGAGKV